MNTDPLTLAVLVLLVFCIFFLALLYLRAARAKKEFDLHQPTIQWLRINNPEGEVHIVPAGQDEHHLLSPGCPCSPWWSEVSEAWKHNDNRLRNLTSTDRLLHEAEIIKDISQ